MPGLILWKKQHINRLKKDIDTMFDRVWGEYGITSAHRVIKRMPSFELTETENSIILVAVLPYINPDDLELSITGDLITFSGKINRDIIKEGDNFYRTYDSFSRTIKIPFRIDADQVEAVYENGFLKVVMPKPPREETRIIMIKKMSADKGRL